MRNEGCRLLAALATVCCAAALGAGSAAAAPVAAQNAITTTNHASDCVNQAGQQEPAQAQISGASTATAISTDLDDATDAAMLGPSPPNGCAASADRILTRHGRVAGRPARPNL